MQAELTTATLVLFLVSLIVSSLIIFVVTSVLGETEDAGTAVGAALVGAVIYALSYFFLGDGLYAAMISGLFWLIAIGTFYNMSNLKALGVALLVWVAASFVGAVVPTLIGPL